MSSLQGTRKNKFSLISTPLQSQEKYVLSEMISVLPRFRDGSRSKGVIGRSTGGKISLSAERAVPGGIGMRTRFSSKREGYKYVLFESVTGFGAGQVFKIPKSPCFIVGFVYC